MANVPDNSPIIAFHSVWTSLRPKKSNLDISTPFCHLHGGVLLPDMPLELQRLLQLPTAKNRFLNPVLSLPLPLPFQSGMASSEVVLLCFSLSPGPERSLYCYAVIRNAFAARNSTKPFKLFI